MPTAPPWGFLAPRGGGLGRVGGVLPSVRACGPNETLVSYWVCFLPGVAAVLLHWPPDSGG
eukprot:3797723-Alexandrium_andersonii.AAC.1